MAVKHVPPEAEISGVGYVAEEENKQK